MVNKLALVTVAMLALAGCGTVPGTLHATSADSTVRAKYNTTQVVTTLTVPASVMTYVDDHLDKVHQQYVGDQVSTQVTLKATSDNFRTTADVDMQAKSTRNLDGSQTFTLAAESPYYAQAKNGMDVQYFLVVQGTAFHQGSNGLSIKRLDDFYVSNYGQNFHGTLVQQVH